MMVCSYPLQNHFPSDVVEPRGTECFYYRSKGTAVWGWVVSRFRQSGFGAHLGHEA